MSNTVDWRGIVLADKRKPSPLTYDLLMEAMESRARAPQPNCIYVDPEVVSQIETRLSITADLMNRLSTLRWIERESR